jgi:hypothetical protein
MASYFKLKAGIHLAEAKGLSGAWINYPFGITGIRCDFCRKTWAAGHVLPHECPPDLRRRLRAVQWPLPVGDHRILVAECRQSFHTQGIEVGEILPGSDFLPTVNTTWNYRPVDFLMELFGSAVVSQRIFNIFREMQWTGAEFFPAKVIQLPRKVDFGWLNPLVRRYPDDPSHIAEELGGTLLDDPYFQLVVVGESRWIWPLIAKCEVCGGRDYVPGIWALSEDQWQGHDIFRLLPTKCVAVTQRVKVHLKSVNATGVEFQALRDV